MRITCEVDGCESTRAAKGLCQRHYMKQWRKSAAASRPKEPRPPCIVDGCEKPRHGGGLCKNHWGQKAHKAARIAQKQADPRICGFCGAPIPPEKRRRGPTSFCSRACKQKDHVASGSAALVARRHYYKREYSMTLEQAEELVRDAHCAICGTDEWPGRHKRPHIDHDHETGRVRGVLCSECNVGLGKFRDDPALLEAAREYLTP